MSESSQNQAPNATVTVVPVDATHWIARVGEHELALAREGDEHRVRDVEFAAWLGYARPRKVRELIERIWPENQRPNCRPTVGRQSAGRNGTGTREFIVNEYWLTREQALKVAAKSETPRAVELLDLIVRVFLAVIDGKTATLDPRVAVLNARPLGPLPADFVSEHITEPIKLAVMLRASLPGAKSQRSILRTITNRVRQDVAHVRPGSAWRNYPADPARLSELLCRIEREVNDAHAAVKAARREQRLLLMRVDERQLSLFWH